MTNDIWLYNGDPESQRALRVEVVRSDLEDLEVFLEILTAALHEAADRHVDRVIERAKGREVDWSVHHPHWFDRPGELLRHAFLIGLMSTVEYHLSEFCAVIENRVALPIGVNDSKGSVVDRSRKYLQQITEFRISPSPSDWEFMGDMWCLRNLLVHNQGFLTGGGSKRVLTMINRTDGINGAFENPVEIELEFCQLAHERVVALFECLNDREAALVQVS